MNKRFLTIFVVTMGMTVAISSHAFAAEVSFVVVPETTTSDSVVVEARIDPQSKNLNVIEGTLQLSGTATAVVVNISRSVFTLWPTSPYYDKTNGTIRFTGGVPNGFTREGQLFTIALTSPTGEPVTFAWKEGGAYINDGKGTKESISSRSIAVQFDEKEPAKVDSISKDGVEPKTTKSRNDMIVVSIVVALALMCVYVYKKIYKK